MMLVRKAVECSCESVEGDSAKKIGRRWCLGGGGLWCSGCPRMREVCTDVAGEHGVYGGPSLEYRRRLATVREEPC